MCPRALQKPGVAAHAHTCHGWQQIGVRLGAEEAKELLGRCGCRLPGATRSAPQPRHPIPGWYQQRLCMPDAATYLAANEAAVTVGEQGGEWMSIASWLSRNATCAGSDSCASQACTHLTLMLLPTPHFFFTSNRPMHGMPPLPGPEAGRSQCSAKSPPTPTPGCAAPPHPRSMSLWMAPAACSHTAGRGAKLGTRGRPQCTGDNSCGLWKKLKVSRVNQRMGCNAPSRAHPSANKATGPKQSTANVQQPAGALQPAVRVRRPSLVRTHNTGRMLGAAHALGAHLWRLGALAYLPAPHLRHAIGPHRSSVGRATGR